MPTKQKNKEAYRWDCKHCGKGITYQDMKNHLHGIHPNEIDLSKPFLNHFSRGPLREILKENEQYESKALKHCQKCVSYANTESHLCSIAHGKEGIEIGSSARDHFTQAELIVRDERTKCSWICNYCGDGVAYDSMGDHLRSKEHENDKTIVIQSMEGVYLAKNHFSRGELQPLGDHSSSGKESASKPRQRLSDFTWNCKYCQKRIGYFSTTSHMRMKHKNKFESSNLPVRSHFTQGALREVSGRKRVKDYKWKCKHCDKQVMYDTMKYHLRSVHKNEFESSNLPDRNHFTQGTLREASERKGVKDYKWKCKYCDKQVVYDSMKYHLRSVHKKEFESSNLPVRGHFTQGSLSGRKRVKDYKWKCNYCESEVGYEHMKNHLLSVSHRSDGIEIGSSLKNHFTRGQLVIASGRELVEDFDGSDRESIIGSNDAENNDSISEELRSFEDSLSSSNESDNNVDEADDESMIFEGVSEIEELEESKEENSFRNQSEVEPEQQERDKISSDSWECRHCGDEVVSRSMYRHLHMLHKNEFRSSSLPIRSHFSQREVQLSSEESIDEVNDRFSNIFSSSEEGSDDEEGNVESLFPSSSEEASED